MRPWGTSCGEDGGDGVKLLRGLDLLLGGIAQ